MGAQQGKESTANSGSLPRHHQHHGMVLQHPDAIASAPAGGCGGAEPIPTVAAPKSRIRGLRTRSSQSQQGTAASAPPPAMPRSVSPKAAAAGSSGDGVAHQGKEGCGRKEGRKEETFSQSSAALQSVRVHLAVLLTKESFKII